MEQDLDQSRPNETSLEYYSRRLDKMTPEELIAAAPAKEDRTTKTGKITPATRVLARSAKAEEVRQLLMEERARARTPEQVAADDAIMWERVVNATEPERLERLTEIAEKMSAAPTFGAGEHEVASTLPPEDRDLFLEVLRHQYTVDQTLEKAGYVARAGMAFLQGALDVGMPIAKFVGAVAKLTPEQERYKQDLMAVRGGTDPMIRPDTPYFGRAVQQVARMAVPMGMAVGAGGALGGAARTAGLGKTGVGVARAIGTSGQFLPQIADRTYTSLIGEGVDPKAAWKITAISAPIEAAIESILPNPFSGYGAAFRGTARQVAGKLLKQYTVNFTKELTEEGLQGIVNETALEVGRTMEQKIPGKGFGNILMRGVSEMAEAAAPLAIMVAPGAAVGAAGVAQESASRPGRLAQMKAIRSERVEAVFSKVALGGSVTRRDGQALGLSPDEAKSAKTRTAAVKRMMEEEADAQRIEETAPPDAGRGPRVEAEILPRPEPGRGPGIPEGPRKSAAGGRGSWGSPLHGFQQRSPGRPQSP
jgi:hypothetical protein